MSRTKREAAVRAGEVRRGRSGKPRAVEHVAGEVGKAVRGKIRRGRWNTLRAKRARALLAIIAGECYNIPTTPILLGSSRNLRVKCR